MSGFLRHLAAQAAGQHRRIRPLPRPVYGAAALIADPPQERVTPEAREPGNGTNEPQMTARGLPPRDPPMPSLLARARDDMPSTDALAQAPAQDSETRIAIDIVGPAARSRPAPPDPRNVASNESIVPPASQTQRTDTTDRRAQEHIVDRPLSTAEPDVPLTLALVPIPAPTEARERQTIATVAAGAMRPAARGQSTDATEIHISIGRIEIAALHEAPQPKQPSARTPKPMALDEYLARKSGRHA